MLPNKKIVQWLNIQKIFFLKIQGFSLAGGGEGNLCVLSLDTMSQAKGY